MGLFDKLKGKKKDNQNEPEKNGVLSTQLQPEQVGKETWTETIETPDLDDLEKGKNKLGFFKKLQNSLSKTRKNITGKIESLVKSSKKLDDEFWDEMEEILIQADCGVKVAIELVENMRATAKKNKIDDPSKVMGLLQAEVVRLLGTESTPLNIPDNETAVILVVGVNGAGKTTSIAKLAHRFKNENRRVLISAADTFRAAAIDQLQIWADRTGVELIRHQEGSDPGAVVFDSLNAARARNADILLIDTAGRLQNKTNLMKEIGKVRKVIEREIPTAPHEVLLVLDATTGQNAISQARIFEEATGVTGVILTKLDGTAKGGIVLAVSKEMEIPVKLVGIGEGLDDLRDFSPQVFAQALFEEI